MEIMMCVLWFVCIYTGTCILMNAIYDVGKVKAPDSTCYVFALFSVCASWLITFS